MNEKLKVAIELQKRYSNITFRKFTDKKDQLIIEAIQGKSFQGVYFDAKRLREIVHETYDGHIDGFLAGAVPYDPPAHDVVSPEWLSKQLTDYEIRSKLVAKDLALSKSYFSSHLNGLKPMSNNVQAMYFYYFKSK